MRHEIQGTWDPDKRILRNHHNDDERGSSGPHCCRANKQKTEFGVREGTLRMSTSKIK